MKTIIDKIILSTFYILSIFAFFLMVEELPIILNKLFNTTLFENSVILSFGFCIFILGYVLNYFDKQKTDIIKENKNQQERTLFMENTEYPNQETDTILKSKIIEKIKNLNKQKDKELKGLKGQDRYFVKQIYQYKIQVLEELMKDE